jgi:hypothetical protein
VKKDLEACRADVVQNAVGDLWMRLHDSTTTLRDRLDKDGANYLREQHAAWAEVPNPADDILAAMAGGCSGDLGRAAP